MNTGLSTKDTNSIINAIQQHPHIKCAKIFGSRAKGTYKTGSDIDIALYMHNDCSEEERKNTLFKLHETLDEELPLPYFFDIVDIDTIESIKLKEHIELRGVLLYSNQQQPPIDY